jgi:hypothetical protein
MVALDGLKLSVVIMTSDSPVRVDIEIDLSRLSYKFDKILRILRKECPNLADSYIVSILLVAFFEEFMGAELSPETLSALRTVFVDAHKSSLGD